MENLLFKWKECCIQNLCVSCCCHNSSEYGHTGCSSLRYAPANMYFNRMLGPWFEFRRSPLLSIIFLPVGLQHYTGVISKDDIVKLLFIFHHLLTPCQPFLFICISYHLAIFRAAYNPPQFIPLSSQCSTIPRVQETAEQVA